ncbi:MAG: 1-deoxy-D-xylulose-5-phosphate reductoisomerase [Actinomycetota bacterium]
MGRIAATSVSILGSTGSIGTQALDVIERATGAFRVHALVAHTDVDVLMTQIDRFRPRRVALVDPRAAGGLRERLTDERVEVLDGPDALTELAKDDGADVVLNAVVGAAGLEATLASLDAGRRVALANKESCVAGGPLVARRLAMGAELIPVDSEHASTHMCLKDESHEAVTRLVLTASGGPFRGRPREDLAKVTPTDALRHPTWNMGAKITIDSATLMNKGLEVIEANVLFGLGFDDIEVVVHPQSVVHCLVEFRDGAWKAAVGLPDMRVPIAYALGYPVRPDWRPERVDWSSMSDLSFEPVDAETFRCLPLAFEAGRAGGTAPAVLNAANEIAVAAFLSGDLGFLAIADVVARVVGDGAKAELGYGAADVELGEVLRADAWARERTRAVVSG